MLTQQKVANDMLQTTRSSYEGDLQQQEQELSMLSNKFQQVWADVWKVRRKCGHSLLEGEGALQVQGRPAAAGAGAVHALHQDPAGCRTMWDSVGV